MGDRRFTKTWEALVAAPDRLAAVRALPDAEVVSALAASRTDEDPFLANVLATEAHNRLTRQEAVFDSIREGVIIYGPDKRPVRVNGALEAILGFERDELMQDSIATSLFDPADLATYTKKMEEGGRAASPVKTIIGMRCKDGSRIETEHTLTFLWDKLGNRNGAVMVIRDITNERRAVDALEQTTRKLRAIVEHTPVLMALLDPQYRFVVVNSAYAKSVGRPPEDFVGSNHFDLFPGVETRRLFDEVVEHHKAYDEKGTFFDHPDRGATWWDWRVEPIEDDDGELEYLLITSVDCTHHQQRRAEEARAR